MRFVAIGLSHKTAPIEIRERFAKNTKDLPACLRNLKDVEFVDEACVVSTCNRVEFYVYGSAEPPTLARAVRNHIQSFSGLPPSALEPHLYQHEGEDALRHLFRVSSSLDSMVLGEPQILGQVKEAYRGACTSEAVGAGLTKIFQRAFNIAKRVRTETGIAENAVSMSFAAVELGREIFDSLEGKEVLLVGAGKMGTLAAKHLGAYGVKQVRVVSRTLQTAAQLAKDVGGTASSMDDLPMLLNQADIVICSTAAQNYVIDKKMMKTVVRNRRYRPILFVDIAVPRDVSPSVADLDNVFVYDVDDLEQVLVLNRETRAKEADAAHALIEAELQSFLRWAKSQQVVPVIKALRAKASGIAATEVQRTLTNVGATDKKTQQSIRAMANSIVNKMLHPVMSQLKHEGAHGDPQELLNALVTLFSIEVEEEPPPSTTDADDDSNVVQLRRDQGGS